MIRPRPRTGEIGGSSGCSASRTFASSATGTTRRRKYSKFSQSRSSVASVRLGSRRRLQHLGVVVLRDEGAAAGRHGEPGAGPAVDGDPVVTEHGHADGPHGPELLAEQVELLLASGTAEPDVVHRRRVLDRDEREARLLVARLQPLERRAAPAPRLLGTGRPTRAARRGAIRCAASGTPARRRRGD